MKVGRMRGQEAPTSSYKISMSRDVMCSTVTLVNNLHCNFESCSEEGTWVAQSVKRLTSAQVMISYLVGSSPALGSVLTAQSLEPVSDSVSPLSLLFPPLTLCLSLSLSQK